MTLGVLLVGENFARIQTVYPFRINLISTAQAVPEAQGLQFAANVFEPGVECPGNFRVSFDDAERPGDLLRLRHGLS